MIIHDITLPISESLVVWPGDPGIRLERQFHLDRGDDYSLTRMEMGVHTGTHVDAPSHFIRGGLDIESLDLRVLVGPALVVHVPAADVLSAEVLEELEIPPGTERVLFRTRNSELWANTGHAFDTDYVAITESGARWLIARGVRLVGIDYLSAAAMTDLLTAHHVLLGDGVVALEGLDLRGISPGGYLLACLPLLIDGAEGAPARAVLIEGDQVA